MNTLSPEQLEELRQIDSPTIANAIETFRVRDATEGYASLQLRCMLPELPPVIGYAVTCTVDSTTPGDPGNNQLSALYRAVHDALKPAIVVMMDIGPDRTRGCHVGDVMSTTFQRLGAVAVVTDGGVRDLDGVRERAAGFQLFAAGTVVSHGVNRIVEVGPTVSIFGLQVRPGDLLHGDANGLVSIPQTIADRVAAEARAVWKREAERIAFITGDDFTLTGLIGESDE